MFASKKVGDLEVLISDASGIELLPHANNSHSEIQKNLLFKNLDGKVIVFSDVIIYKDIAWGIVNNRSGIGLPIVGTFANTIRTKRMVKRLHSTLFEPLYSETKSVRYYNGLEALESGDYQAFVEGFKVDTGDRKAYFSYKGDFFEDMKEKIKDLDFSPKLLKDVLVELTFQCEKRLPISDIALKLVDGCLDQKPLIKDAIKNLVNLDISLKMLFQEKFRSPRLRYSPPSFNPFLNSVENFNALSVYNVEIMFDLFVSLRMNQVSESQVFSEQKFNELRALYLEVAGIFEAVKTQQLV